ncbi:capsule assembly Wzi family protein [Altibacter sp.]|uniref:capsule assembly Wzi family protein n=1 Tax=Altibacter sp. TaxID=2024823 RepID=UPI000C9624C1|nr:capsule assembly Wzi family protein [Altibacter sp.]MAP55572.1 hypothetical protein [Altibacter sp.]
MKSHLIVLFLLLGGIGIAQELDYNGSIEATGAFSNEEELPFWFYTNTNTALNAETNISGTASFQAVYSFENSSIGAGVAAFYRDGVSDAFQRRDMYVSFENSFLKATLGAKKREAARNGLSTTHENFLWSQNARPLPGIRLEANDPIRLSNTFALDWGIAHYQLNDDRYVQDTRVHYKRLGLITSITERNTITARIQHVAQWGGTSPVYGDFPDGLDTFFDVFIAKKRTITVNGTQLNNAVGNHLGTYYLEFERSLDRGTFTVYHEHPFEDGSGTRWANFPDGIWGVMYTTKAQGWISSILYEYVDTSDQSGDTGDSAVDNYFTNNLYRSGWSYDQTTIGFPFIIYDPTIPVTETTSPLRNNRVKVHHLGVAGAYKNFDWMIKSSYATLLGNYRAPIDPPVKNWYNSITLTYNTQRFGSFILQGGLDRSNTLPTVVGGGLTYRYRFSSQKP